MKSALAAALLCAASPVFAQQTSTPPRAVWTPEPPRRPVTAPAPEQGPPAPTSPAAASPPPPPPSGPDCQQRLAAVATFTAAEPPKGADAACTVIDPVRLAAVQVVHRGGAAPVALSAPPLITCEAALAVAEWVRESVAPLARGHFDEALTELGVGGGFECRARNHQAGAPRSEHSYGRALDVMHFKTTARLVKVEKSPPPAAKPFLDSVWASACGQFSTALGPEADAFHATHLHVDLQPRRAASSKFCE